MWLRKKKKDDYSRGARRPSFVDGLGTKPVFSYHAQSARTEPAGVRRVTKLLWASPAADKPSPRRTTRPLPRRVLTAALAVLIVALLLSNLFLTRDPVVMVHEQADGRQLLLRSQAEYQEAARELLAGSLANTNKLTINTREVADELQKKFPELAYVSVVLPIIGRQPTIHIQTTRPVLVLASSRSGGVFLVDESGRAVMDAAKVAASVKDKLPVVQDQSGLPVTVGDGALPSDNVDFITEVIGQLAAKGIRVAALVLPPAAGELDVRIEGAPYFVKFNLRGDARVEAGAFLAVKQQLERENKTPSSYIDVRVENKAYYR